MRRGNEEGIVQTGMIRTELAPDASCADLIRASIVFVKSFCEEGWIAGSSPAMTGASTCRHARALDEGIHVLFLRAAKTWMFGM
jgi:hypothetical protein